MDLMIYLLTFVVVFLINLIPIFGPPTWMVLSFVAFTYKIPSVPLFIFVAVCASTLGRYYLTLSSKKIIRNRLLGDSYRRNIDHLREHIENRKKTISGIFLAEAFTPLPSDQFFVAYGLTGMKARYALVPFFFGRIFTYSLWVLTATEVSKRAALSALADLSFFSSSFIIVELVIIFLVYLFVRIDWEHFILHHEFRFFR